MRSLTVAREVCERFHPGLLAALERMPLHEREAEGSRVVEVFRAHGGPGLLVPRQHGGSAADPLDAVRVQRAVSALSPSLGVGLAMHHFTVAMLFALAETAGRLTDAQLKVLSGIASDGLLLASGWAEGRTDQNILLPSVVARPTDGGYLVNGSKKPCSLSASMNILTASVALPGPDGRNNLALLLIPAGSAGISTTPFWVSPILAAAQSHEVRLENVFVPQELVIQSTAEDESRLDDLQTVGFTWFELLATSIYVGAASHLVAQLVATGRGSVSDRVGVARRLEAAVDLVEGAARAMNDGVTGDEAVASVLVARYAVQDLLAVAVNDAAELLGGLTFMRTFDVAYLISAVRALAFHPPSRTSTVEALGDYFAGAPLNLS
ncbi:acyl-CoA dehydrogenase family protein [Salinispora pacifica]|uniref:acyl-CoA dehydrogenase family protein n=1 Tax=Salinispora pacifica TaxID=351187 RepID=UPI00047665CE|nr:acyl-CoA dehydrogenase family protein [Salinispora pacifica]